MVNTRPVVVVIGAGFAGLEAVRALRHTDARVILIDRKNHHTFQPLLYQVASAGLSPADITAPIRRIVTDQQNCEVVLGEVDGVDTDAKTVHVNGSDVAYDYLIVATGARHSYFGKDEWARYAPGLKTVEDAVEIRRRVLLAFETAEMETDEEARRAALTFVIVGAGPTGVEMAGSLSEIALNVIRKDYRHIDTASARIILIEANDRVLASMDGECSRSALDQLQQLRVSVWLGKRVTDIDGNGVTLADGERVAAGTVIWAAGVQGSRLGRMVSADTDRSGRVPVDERMEVPGKPGVFVVGDLAHAVDANGRQVPGVAQGAIQTGRYVGRMIAQRVKGSTEQPAPFSYTDKGMLATIGRHRATGTVFGKHVNGFVAWTMWAWVHLFFLIGFRNRLVVMMQWTWGYLTHGRGARLITGGALPRLKNSRESGGASRAA